MVSPSRRCHNTASFAGGCMRHFLALALLCAVSLAATRLLRAAAAIPDWAYAKAMTPEETRQAAEYFGAMPWTPWIRVVETATVPKMVSRGGIWIPVESGEKEPIGVRIVETPENAERTEVLRDPHSGFIAY